MASTFIAVKCPSAWKALQVVVESASAPVGCLDCGVIVHSAGRKTVELIDAPVCTAPAHLVWVKCRWRCAEPDCTRGVFTEQNPKVAAPRALLTCRCIAYGVLMMRREN